MSVPIPSPFGGCCCGGGPCYSGCPCYAAIAASLIGTCTITANTCNPADVGSDSDDLVSQPWPTLTPGDFSDFLCNSTAGLHYSCSGIIGSRSYTLDLYCPCDCSPKAWKYVIGEECGQQRGTVTFTCDPILATIPFEIVCSGEGPSCTLTGTFTITE
ncbi:hypothetical protein BH11PLA2_BH11PLA2_32450 [soil metagenome]